MVAPSVTGLLHPGELGRGEPFRGQTGWGLRHGGVDADDLLREPAAEDGRHHCAPVAAVREEPVVAEPSHELRPGGGDPLDAPSGGARPVAEPEARQGRGDDVERRSAAVGRLGQLVDDVDELGDAAGSAVCEHQRRRICAG